MRYTSLGLVGQAQGRGTLWRRHLPPALILVAVALLVLAAARPSAVVVLPMPQQTILLLMDASVSMKAQDVKPNRMKASQQAAEKFVNDLPVNVRVGVIAYGGTAHLVQHPTLNHDDAVAAIADLRFQRSTGIGEAIIVALGTLFPDQEIAVPGTTSERGDRLKSAPIEPQDHETTVRAAPGSYQDAAIVLLTDGQNTSGPSPIDAAQLAADRGVRIFTVGFGTKDGEVIGYQGMRMRVSLDEQTLRNVANLTLGQYFYAGSGSELEAAYDVLKNRVVLEKKRTEIAFAFAGIAALLVAIATVLSLWWSGRVA
ncbi:VWA domain-containing protein [Variovorax sp. Sphag1AA]|uniref:VWA domain-containing protein n=1 Tax=Variovorax sp. Sphag1AA TaxID=2587027 RepID=UPI001617B37A|nr:VWA domain-containing protein [Variovorax sp. Sphag1AA]MBB3181186.1 Ca-activated chloride channel family protein [Variovorax sp. Sphag1AA]